MKITPNWQERRYFRSKMVNSILRRYIFKKRLQNELHFYGRGEKEIKILIITSEAND